jgi:hypothetical protein
MQHIDKEQEASLICVSQVYSTGPYGFLCVVVGALDLTMLKELHAAVTCYNAADRVSMLTEKGAAAS